MVSDDNKKTIVDLYKLLMCESGTSGKIKDSYQRTHDHYSDYCAKVREYAKKSNPTEEERNSFYKGFLWDRKNGVASIGNAVAWTKDRAEGGKYVDRSVVAKVVEPLIALAKKKPLEISDDDIANVDLPNIRKRLYAAANNIELNIIFNRALASVLSNRVSPCVNEGEFNRVYDWFKGNGFIVEGNGCLEDWYSRNTRLMSFLHKALEDIENIDCYYIGGFVRRVFDALVGFEERKGHQIVKYGPPGTGKTFTAQAEMQQMLNAWTVFATGGKVLLDEADHIYKIQFHPSYGYEDFMDGLRPSDQAGALKLVNGDFKTLCKEAGKWECDLYRYVARVKVGVSVEHLLDKAVDKIKEQFEEEQEFAGEHWTKIWKVTEYSPKLPLRDAIPPYCMLIDEINRAELSRVFGELMFALEYRGPEGMIRTQNSRLDYVDEKTGDTAMIRVNDGTSRFFVPHNVFVCGTMNTIDRSVESFDFALRRRFLWQRIDVDEDVAEEWLVKNVFKKKDGDAALLVQAVHELNVYIANELSEDHKIGHAYLMKYSTTGDHKWTLKSAKDELWETAIEPLLEEYLRGTGRTTDAFRKKFFSQKNPNEKNSRKQKVQTDADVENNQD